MGVFYNVSRSDGESYVLYTLSGAPKEAFAQFGLPRNTPIFGPTFRGEGIVRLDDVKKVLGTARWRPTTECRRATCRSRAISPCRLSRNLAP